MLKGVLDTEVATYFLLKPRFNLSLMCDACLVDIS